MNDRHPIYDLVANAPFEDEELSDNERAQMDASVGAVERGEVQSLASLAAELGIDLDD